MAFIEHSAFRRLAYYLGSSDFFSRHDDNNFSPADNKRYLRSVSSLRGHLRLLQREPKLEATAFERTIALMEEIHENMPRLLKQTGTEAGLECLAALECQVEDLGKALSGAAGFSRAEKKRSGGAVLPSWESFAGQWENTSLAAGSGLDQTPAPPKGDSPVPGNGLTAASFMDSESFAAQAEQRRAKSAAAKDRLNEPAGAAANPESAGRGAGEKSRPAVAAERNTEANARPSVPEELSPEALASCTEYFTASAALHGRAARIWGLLACAAAVLFCSFFYYASFDSQIGARTTNAGYEGFFFADLLLTKAVVFLLWFCVILLCIRSCRIERELQARMLHRQMSLNLFVALGNGLDSRGRGSILAGIIAPETTARRHFLKI